MSGDRDHQDTRAPAPAADVAASAADDGGATDPRLSAALRAERRVRGLIDTHHQVHELMMAHAPLPEVLDTLVRGVQAQTDGLRGSILLLDAEKGQLRHASAPDLPPEWCQMIDGVDIGPRVGSCGAAAYTGLDVLVPDVRTDERWAPYQEAATGLGLMSCWSVPIRGSANRVLGTVAFYGSKPTVPTAAEVDLLHQMARLAAVALERDQVGRELRSLAHTDALTGLPNRTAILRHLERELWTAGDEPVTVLFVDLDRFKLINDSLGHDVGDVVLRRVAELLTGAVRTEDLVGRWGGDEFVVVPAPHARSAQAAQRLADRLTGALRDPIRDDTGRDHAITASIGITCATDASAVEAIRQADTAMYAAKRGRTGIARFSTTVDQARTDELRIVDGLRTALQRGELRLAYQPIVDLRTGSVAGLEALLRWSHPELGEVAPDRFVPIAEDHQLMAPIEAWVLRTAITQAARWNQVAGSDLRMSVNLSVAQPSGGEFAGALLETAALVGIAPDLLRVEITETAVVGELDGLIVGLRRLREAGVHVVLDDFGTGASSLSHLRDLPIDGIKIDQVFLADVTADSDGEGLIEGIASLARNMGLEVTAEGIETPHQADLVRRAQIPLGQGFMFAEPMNVQAIDAELKSWFTGGKARRLSVVS